MDSEGNSLEETIIITKPVINTITSKEQTICIGEIPESLEISYTGSSLNPTYQWFSNTINTNTGGQEIQNTNTPNYTPETSVASGIIYYLSLIHI